MDKRVVVSAKAPRPVGPYSQAIEAGGFIFLAGQVGLVPETGQLAQGIQAQSAQCLENIKGILSSMGQDLSAVVKMSVFLTDMADFQEMNKVYGGFFPSEPPARTTVAVKALPLGASVEMEALAIKAL